MVGTRPTPPAAASDVRAQTLAAATRLFAAHGVEATSLQAIADEVGVAKQSLLHYFPSKDDLRRGVFDGMLAHWRDALPRLVLAAEVSEGRFDAVTAALVDFFHGDPDRARLLVRESLDRPAAVRALVSEHVRLWLEMFADRVRAGQSRGEHRDDVDPEAYVLVVLQLVVTAAALHAVVAPAFGASAHAPRATRDAAEARYRRELIRVAKTSLFVAPSSPRRRKARR